MKGINWWSYGGMDIGVNTCAVVRDREEEVDLSEVVFYLQELFVGYWNAIGIYSGMEMTITTINVFSRKLHNGFNEYLMDFVHSFFH